MSMPLIAWAVAISVADEPTVESVLGLAPWIPERLPLDPLRGKRLGCYCAPAKCHGDVLVELLERRTEAA